MIKKEVKSIKLNQNGCIHNVSYYEWSSENSHNKDIEYVYCVHRLTGDGRDFNFIANDLITDNENRIVICVDIPGRGKSDYLSDPTNYHVLFYATDMVQLIETISKDADIDYIGTSMGGLIGMVLNQMPKQFKIRNLILNDIGPQVSYQSLNYIANYIQNYKEFNSRHDAEIYLKSTHKGFGQLTESQWSFLFNNCIIEKDSKFMFHYDRNIAVKFQPVEIDLDLWEVFNKIECNVLVLRGKESDILTKQVYDKMLEKSNRHKGIEFDNVGHAPMLFSTDQIEPTIKFINNGKLIN